MLDGGVQKKVGIYIRVSTTKQELDNQLQQLKDYCAKSNWSTYNVYADIITGKEESRPEYDKLFVDAHQKKFDVVLFWALDRFARSGTLFTLQKLKELENVGIDWHSYTEPYISSIGPWKDVVISILATVAKLEREHISDRTKAGLQRIKAEGKTLGRPKIPPEAVERVVALLKEGKSSYRQISQQVTYKIKFGKEKHVSPAQITQINKTVVQKGGLENDT